MIVLSRFSTLLSAGFCLLLGQGTFVSAAAIPPETAALSRVRLFPEPLAPVGGEPSAAENGALAAALRGLAPGAPLTAVDAFIQAHPHSPWVPSLLLNRGLRRFEQGYFSSALADWTQAWTIGRAARGSSPDGEALVARALAEAVKMHCRVGRVAEAKALLAEFGDRPVVGLNASMLDQSRKAIGQMETLPADCFKCGPYALSSILLHQRAHTPQTYACVTAYPTTAQGTSLAQVAELANGPLGMKMQPVRRTSTKAALPLPAVVHWKLEHYGAVLEFKDGRYLLVDPTFGTSQWILAEALAEEASGYFLIAAGKLPAGFESVATAQAGKIWGRGNCADGDGAGTGKNDPKMPSCPRDPGMADWSVHSALASLNIEDTPLSYRTPFGPRVAFRVNYSQLEQNQPTTINYSNVGPLWNLNWVSSLTFDSNNAFARMGEGGTELFTRFNGGTQSYDPEQATGALLVRVSASLYERRAVDGSKLVFGLPDGSGRIFLTQQVDPQGNALTFGYDANFRLVTVTDAIGQVTTIEHGSNTPGDPLFFRVTKVTDPFGRFTTLAYNASQRLISITDTIGIVSQFTYDAGGKVNSLITPYGTTTFTFGTSNVAPAGVVSFVEVTEPSGAKQRVESVQTSVIPQFETVVPAGMPTINNYMQWRNSFYWDRRAMAEAPGDYTKAEILHFQHLNVSAIKANVLESTKSPLGNRVWYAYPGQGDPIFTTQGMGARPSHVGRVLDDGSTQLYKYSYNAQGNVTQATDPLGRVTKLSYAANGVDLLTIKQVNAQGGDDLLATYTWNAQHRPVSVTDASGQTTSFTYNARGQLTSITNARNEVATLVYNAQGYLTAFDGPLPGLQDQSTFGYDARGRLASITNAEGYSIALQYDNLDRPTRTTHPDGTYEEVSYTNLDATSYRDRLGRITTALYDSARRPISTTDPLERVTKYQWCACGSLSQLEDALGRITRWEQDLMGRPTAKIYPDGTRESFRYETTTDRLASYTDPRGQTKGFLYHLDNSLRAALYPSTPGVSATPVAWYDYDSAYPRLRTVTDGTGVTTYSYGPVTGGVAASANRLAEIHSTWTNSRIAFSYDELGRVLTRSIDGAAQTVERDVRGRVSTLQNVLGSFVYTYEGTSSRVSRVDFPNGQAVQATYFGDLGGRRLQQKRNLAPGGATLSQFDYLYNAGGLISSLQETIGASPVANSTMSYDALSQLTGVNTPGRIFDFSYDAAGNRLTRTLNGSTTSYSYNILNELQSASPALGADKTYSWDAEDRLVRIDYAGGNANTRLTYDASGRCVGISEYIGETLVSEKRFVWSGFVRVEERTAAGTVTRRFFQQGEQSSGANYYYALDHLGSVRELTDASGAVRARYAYDPFGVRTKVSGDLEATAGFTGHYFHGPSGLHLTRFRSYDAASARWLSRDPLKERAGGNLFAYVHNNPVNAVDPLGLIDGFAATVAALNLVGNAAVFVGGGAVALAGGAATLTVPGAGQLAGPPAALVGAAFAGRAGYGALTNAANFGAALADQPGLSKGSLAADAVERIAPGNAAAQAAVAGGDMLADLATGNLGSVAARVGPRAAEAAGGAVGKALGALDEGLAAAGIGLGGSGAINDLFPGSEPGTGSDAAAASGGNASRCRPQ